MDAVKHEIVCLFVAPESVAKTALARCLSRPPA